MSISQEILDIVDAATELPGWRVEDRGNQYWLYPDDGPIIHLAKRGYRGRASANVRAALRRAGFPDGRREDSGPMLDEPDRGDVGEVLVVERAPDGDTPGVEELLLEDGTVVFGCSSCLEVRFEDRADAVVHQSDHISTSPASVSEKQTVSPVDITISEEAPPVTTRPSARLNGGPGHEMTNEDVVDLLTRAAGLIQRVAAGVAARPDQGARVADLERQVVAGRARITELEERIEAMQEAARCLLGGRS